MDLFRIKKILDKQCEKCDKFDPDATFTSLEYEILKLRAKLKACESLVQRWRDSAGESGESAYSEVMECADELEEVMRGEA